MAPGQQLGGVAQQCIADASASSRRTVLALAVVVGAMPRGLVMTSPVATPPAQTPRFRVFAWGAAFAPHQRAARWRLAEFSAGVALAQELRPADGLSSEGISPKWGGHTLLPADFRLQGTRPIVGWSWGGLCAQWLSGGRSLSTQTFRPLHRIQRLPNFLAALDGLRTLGGGA